MTFGTVWLKCRGLTTRDAFELGDVTAVRLRVFWSWPDEYAEYVLNASPAIMDFCAGGFIKKVKCHMCTGELDHSWKNRMFEFMSYFLFLVERNKIV